MTVQTDSAAWVVTPQRGVWIPNGISHRIELAGRVRLRTLYLRAGLSGLEGGVRALHVSPLLRELVLHLVESAPLWMNDQPNEHLLRVLAALVVANPASTIAALAPETGASLRTLERLFVAETTLTPQRWRIRARLLDATRLLAQGASVTSAALACGYSTPSAFAAAFREETGTTPTRYVAGES